jgi:hypothetical protein
VCPLIVLFSSQKQSIHKRWLYSNCILTAKAETLSEKQIVRDMIGRKIDGWKFDAPEEFVSLEVKDVIRQSEVESDYEVQTHVKGLFSGAERDFQLRLTYGKLFTRWKLTGIQQIK